MVIAVARVLLTRRSTGESKEKIGYHTRPKYAAVSALCCNSFLLLKHSHSCSEQQQQGRSRLPD